MGYCHLAVGEKDAETAPTLVIRGTISSYTGAAVVTAKGPSAFAVAFLEG